MSEIETGIADTLNARAADIEKERKDAIAHFKEVVRTATAELVKLGAEAPKVGRPKGRKNNPKPRAEVAHAAE